MKALTKLKTCIVPDVVHDELTGDAIWVTRARIRVPVKRMDDRHLLNTINMLRGKSPIGTRYICSSATRREWLHILRGEAHRRGLNLSKAGQLNA